MKIHFAADHGGYELKEVLKSFVTELGHEVIDHGTNSTESIDYPDVITPCAEAVVRDEAAGVAETGAVFGIILGGSGQGEAMCANRTKGARAVVYYGAAKSQVDSDGKTLNMIQSVREHNNANILSLGARFISVEEAKEIVTTFIETPFSGDERHVRRLGKF